MLRIYKMYDLPFNNSGSVGEDVVAARRVSFSSYPGTLNSGDDFYVLSSGLIQQVMRAFVESDIASRE